MEDQLLVLTDTDIFGESIDLPKDKYQLIYGIFYYAIRGGDYTEECLYNLVVTLCNEYQEPLLRELKIHGWIDLIDYVREWCISNKKQEGARFRLPFISRGHCSIGDLYDCLDFVKQALSSAKTTFTSTYRIFDCEVFKYPFPAISELFTDLYEDYLSHVNFELLDKVPNDVIDDLDNDAIFEDSDIRYSKWCYAMAEGILWEMERRGLPTPASPESELSDICSNMYEEVLLKQEKGEVLSLPEDVKWVENAKEIPMNKRVGVIKYMLECFGVTEITQVRKLAHFVVRDNVPYNSSADPNDSIYNYLIYPKKLFKHTEYFKETLERYGLPIPKGLEDLDNAF